jgi:hypothetical protein
MQVIQAGVQNLPPEVMITPARNYGTAVIVDSLSVISENQIDN